jgi:hypothetical protein
MGPETGDASALAGFDGCALFEVQSFEQMAAAFQDEYYLNVIRPDEHKFVDTKFGVVRTRGEVKRII